MIFTLFRLGGYQIDTCLPFSLYLLHGFCPESEQPCRNRVKRKKIKSIQTVVGFILCLYTTLPLNNSCLVLKLDFDGQIFKNDEIDACY